MSQSNWERRRERDRRRAERRDDMAHAMELRRRAQEEAEARRLIEKAPKEVQTILDRAEKTAARIAAEAASEERRILGANVVLRSGATRSNPDPVPVWHWRLASPSTSLAARLGLGSKAMNKGPLLSLRPGGGIARTDFAFKKFDSADADEEIREWITRAKKTASETGDKYGKLLNKLRDDSAMAELFEAAGVVSSSTRAENLVGVYGPVERRVTVTSVPSLTRVDISQDGLVLRFAHRAGDSAKAWNAKIDALKNLFRAQGVDASNLTVSDDKGGNIVLSFHDTDPFHDVPKSIAIYDGERHRSLIGVTSKGREAFIHWAGNSGMVIGGVPGSGKTASLMPVFAGMADKAEMHVFDGKEGYDLHPLRHIARTYSRSTDVAAPLQTLRSLEELRTRRAEAMYTVLGANNFWEIPLSKRDQHGIKPVFVILDECQTWTDTSGLETEEKRTAEEIIRLIRTLIQKGRSAGIVVILTTQKPDATSIPTKVRDNAALKICFRVSTPEQGVTVLGKLDPNAPDPTRIAIEKQGRAVMETEGQGTVLLQAGYVPSRELEAALATRKPVEDQAEVAARLLGDTARQSSPRAAADPDQVDAEPQPARRLTPEEVRAEAVRMGLIPADDAQEESAEPEARASKPTVKSTAKPKMEGDF